MAECWNCGGTPDDDWSCEGCRTERGLRDEIERLRAENQALRDELEQERQHRRDDLIGQQYRDERLAELQARLDAWVEADGMRDPDDPIYGVVARANAHAWLLAAATKEDDREV